MSAGGCLYTADDDNDAHLYLRGKLCMLAVLLDLLLHLLCLVSIPGVLMVHNEAATDTI